MYVCTFYICFAIQIECHLFHVRSIKRVWNSSTNRIKTWNFSKNKKEEERTYIKKAVLAVAGVEEEAAIKAAHEIYTADIEHELKHEDELADDVRQKLNNEIRKYELESDTQEARRECVVYYAAYNTVRQRTKQRKVCNYELEIDDDGDGPPTIATGTRSKNKYGILRAAAKSAYKVRAIRDVMFDYLSTN